MVPCASPYTGSVLTEYMEASMRAATFEPLDAGEGWYGEVSELDGLWGSGPTEQACRDDLREALESWLLFRLAARLDIPLTPA